MSENNNNAKKQAKIPRESSLDPRRPGLVQPFKRMVEDGLAKITVEFTQLGFQATGVPEKKMVDLTDSGLEVGKVYPVLQLLKIAEGAGLLERDQKTKKKTGGKAEQPLPSKSLCVRDFEGTTREQLMSRATAVCNNANGGTLTGRARQAGSFNGTVTTTFQDWWAGATARQRATALCQAKDLAQLTDAHVNRLAGPMPCPFRGTASFLVSQENEDGGETAEPIQAQTASATSTRTTPPPVRTSPRGGRTGGVGS